VAMTTTTTRCRFVCNYKFSLSSCCCRRTIDVTCVVEVATTRVAATTMTSCRFVYCYVLFSVVLENVIVVVATNIVGQPGL